jgi:nicotinate-nucleotide adenylyltransferase
VSGVVAVFGGSFDPPHRAHLEIVERVIGLGLASRVLVVPCVRHAFGKPLAAYRHRLAMCALMCEEAGPAASASDVEQRLGLSGYTVETLEALARELAGSRLRLVVGADILEEARHWRRFEEVEALAPLLVVARHGYDDAGRSEVPAPAAVSSSEVREILSGGGDAGRLVPAPVLAYIARQGIYAFDQP